MKTTLAPLAAVLALTLAGTALTGPALADSHCIANAGLTPAEAAGLSLTEIAQAKFNRDSSDERQNAQVPAATSADARAQLAAATGLSADQAAHLSLTQLAAVKFTRDGHDNAQIRPAGLHATLATRSVDDRARAQLVSNAGLDARNAATLSLTDIAAAKFDRDNQ